MRSLPTDGSSCSPSRFPAALLASFVMNSWEGALLRMRVEKSDGPLIEVKQLVFGRLLD